MRPWHLGNTTVRSPFRLRDGLVALSTSSLQGNLRGQHQEIAFRNLLGEHGIVELGVKGKVKVYQFRELKSVPPTPIGCSLCR
jgi:hypothetical protein